MAATMSSYQTARSVPPPDDSSFALCSRSDRGTLFTLIAPAARPFIRVGIVEKLPTAHRNSTPPIGPDVELPCGEELLQRPGNQEARTPW
jgi:hypothetical protein